MHAGHPVLQKRLAQRLLCRERGGASFTRALKAPLESKGAPLRRLEVRKNVRLLLCKCSMFVIGVVGFKDHLLEIHYRCTSPKA